MTAPATAALERIRCVLAHTSHPGNIGSAARALRTMGLRRLVLVAPQAFPHPQASALAAGAQDLLEHAQVSVQLAPALADCHLVLGATARHRGVGLVELDPRSAAQRALAAAAAGQQVALLFGNEQSGLSNDEIKHCHAAIVIPTDAGYGSLNLAQAVQVVAWELREAWLAQAQAAPVAEARDPPADSAQMAAFFAHLQRMLDAIDFHKGRSPEVIMQRMHRLFLRAAPDQRELRILHGILADAERMARLAAGDNAQAAPRAPD